MTAPAPLAGSVRRILIWALVGVQVTCGVILILLTGEYWTLAAWAGYAIVGAVILSARPGNWIGRLMLAIGVYWPVSTLLVTPPVVAVMPWWMELLVRSTGYVVWVCVALLVLLYPRGRIDSRLGRGTAWALFALEVVVVSAAIADPAPLLWSGDPNPLGWPPLGDMNVWLSGTSFVVVPGVIAVALVDLVLRWRRSAGAERLQFRWLVYGTAVTVAALLLSIPELPGLEWLGTLVIIGFNAIPISIGIAVTRHGLYEIGRVVSRTVSYLLVTVLAVVVYAGVVVSVSLLLPDQSAVPVALATLAAAATFLPALRWVQHRLDRRFDRERYDAEKIVDAFGRRLRDGADPASTAPELLGAVEQSLAPASVGLWTAGGAR